MRNKERIHEEYVLKPDMKVLNTIQTVNEGLDRPELIENHSVPKKSQKSLMKLLQRQTDQNEELIEENERYAKDQASLLHLLGQKDSQLKKVAEKSSKLKALGQNLFLGVIRKYTYTRSVDSAFEKWKILLFQKSKTQ